jgi:hypothetical protein
VVYIKTLPTILACCIVSVSLAAQTKTPPAPTATQSQSQPAVGVATLVNTIQFIQDQLSAISPVTSDYTVSGDETQSWQWALTYGKVWLQDGCILRYEDKLGLANVNARPFEQFGRDLSKQDPRTVKVENVEDRWREIDLKNGKTNFYHFSKRVYVVADAFYFVDESLADRVAKAYIHAIVLCGGGKDQPF